MTPTLDPTPSPFHPGEVRLQRTLGVAARMEAFGRRVIRDHLPDQHRDFYRQLPFLVAGAVDPAGDAWATILTGPEGFLHSPDPRTLAIAAARDPQDPAGGGLQAEQAVGLLGIELHTRRRNRMNGHIARHDAGGLVVAVDQAFGNCPQYIRMRDVVVARDPGDPGERPPATTSAALDETARRMIAGADTFFVASYIDDETGRHVDVSHRGGKPGFVRIGADGVLTAPDFAGNQHFNTLGNFLLNPRAGLVFADFETGDLLHLTGEARVDLDSDEIAAFQGAERLWTFVPRKVVFRPAALALRWRPRPGGESPNSLMTGDWLQVEARRAAARLGSRWRALRVVRLVDESRDIRSFHLEPADGAGLAVFAAGQHLPIRLPPTGDAAAHVRTYTLSSAPSDATYRISVRRDGAVSQRLHDQMGVGDLLEALPPAGAFILDPHEPRPAVLLGAGVGVTPLISMLRHAVFEGLRTRRIRPVWFVQAAHSLEVRPFDAEVSALAAQAQGAVQVVRALSDPRGAALGRDYELAGRLDAALLSTIAPLEDSDVYLCGPPGFTQGLYDQLRAAGVPDERLHAEAFGPAGLRRDRPAPAAAPVSRAPVPVTFARAGRTAPWRPGHGALLDLAEDLGLAPAFSCRTGQCGTCATKVLSGAVAYAAPPAAQVGEAVALLCCAQPAEGCGSLVLDL